MINEKLLKNLQLGVSQYVLGDNIKHKPSGDHWDTFDDDYYNFVANDNNWETFRRNGITCMLETGLYGRDRKEYIRENKLYDEYYSNAEIVEMGRRVEELESMIGKEFLYSNLECQIGSPRHCIIEGRKYNFDDLYNVYAAWQIHRTFEYLKKKPATILEIGAGYGSLCHKVTKLYPDIKYIILDLPESLLVQHYHLSQTDPSRKIVTLEDMDDIERGDYDVALLPSWYGDKLAELNIDLVINMRSFGEMTKELLDYYFNIIHNSLAYGGIFYCVNRYVFTSSVHKLKLKDYPFDEDWSFLISQPQWLQTHLHEWIALRERGSKISPSFILQSMSERVPPPGPIMEDILPQKTWIKNNMKGDIT